jgi:hypothetical protein
LRLAEAGFTEASRIGCAVELVLHLGDAGDEKPVSEFLEALAGRLEETELRVERVLVFGFGCATGTSPAGLALARRYLGRLGALVGGGSNADLYELNNQRPPADVDVVSWSMNPQVHAFDNASIAETPEAAGQQVSSVGVYLPGTPRAVSPVTLKPRLNPVATTGDRQTSPRELPTQVDLRQLSLFGAVWTLAMIKALAEAGVESMTFYETTGWRGVLEPVSGSVLPGNFAWLPGSVFPLYHVFADIAKFARGQVVRTRSSRPSEIASLYLRAGDRRRLIVANLSPAPHELELPEFEETPRARTLDASTGLAAITAPEEFRSQSEPLRGSRYEIAPYGLLTLDFSGN